MTILARNPAPGSSGFFERNQSTADQQL